jgi:hypothetical protein
VIGNSIDGGHFVDINFIGFTDTVEGLVSLDDMINPFSGDFLLLTRRPPLGSHSFLGTAGNKKKRREKEGP